MTTLIVGAGVIGVSLAWELAAQGEQVIVVDRGGRPADEASRANTGMLTPSQSAPWAAPGMPTRLLSLLLDPASHLKIRPAGVPWATRWGLQFLRHCTAANRQNAFKRNLRLATYSRTRLGFLRRELGLEYDQSTVGTLRVFWTPTSFERAARAADQAGALGVRFQALDRDGSTRIDPTLAALGKALVGTIHCPDDETGDCAAFTERLAAQAVDAGVKFRLGETVRRLEGGAGRITHAVTDHAKVVADRFVLAAGPESVRLAHGIGLRLPIAPVKGYSITAPAIDTDNLPRIPRIDEERAIGITPMGNTVRVGGFIELAGFDSRVVPAQIERMRLAAQATCPTLGETLAAKAITPRACLRPLTVDGPPIIGSTPIPNLFLNTGHGSMGWTMSAGSASVVAALITGRRPEIDLDGLTLARFA